MKLDSIGTDNIIGAESINKSITTTIRNDQIIKIVVYCVPNYKNTLYIKLCSSLDSFPAALESDSCLICTTGLPLRPEGRTDGRSKRVQKQTGAIFGT